MSKPKSNELYTDNDISSISQKIKNKKILFVGLMGSGKTTIGKLLANYINYQFYDLDKEIEKKYNKSIREIFSSEGEINFRKSEAAIIKKLLVSNNNNGMVIASGGGTFLNKETRILAKKQALTIWLRADLDLLYNRTQNQNNRPLLNFDDKKEVLKKLIKERYPIYEEANITVESSKTSKLNMVKKVLNKISIFLSETQIYE